MRHDVIIRICVYALIDKQLGAENIRRGIIHQGLLPAAMSEYGHHLFPIMNEALSSYIKAGQRDCKGSCQFYRRKIWKADLAFTHFQPALADQ